ncbi:MAG TPA: Ig-like domain-containing protein [Blastocatellia bacterium]|nr:Ig-like domain-containing protein [Blastocatellia bacterium]
MKPRRFVLPILVVLCCLSFQSDVRSRAFFQLPPLEIHYINVGWGGSVLVKGPDGTTVLMEAGNTGKGTNTVVPYLQSIGILSTTGLDYTIAGHQHCDHIGGMDEVINAGYNVHVKNYYNGSSNTSTCVTGWNSAAATTTAGAPVPMPVGTVIPLGNGATLTAVAVNGSIIGGGSVPVSDENDRSIAVLIQYGGFDYLWASDLGGGTIDEACTGRFTSSQTDVETSVIQAISPGGASPMINSGGIDVLHVNHHGSESSTNKNWMNLSAPAVAVIGVGGGQTTGWDLPRIDVVEHVLLAQATGCITASPALVVQTEEGAPAGSLTSTAGFCVGNIKVTTDGQTDFTVSGDGQVTQGPNEVAAAGLPRTFTLDDAPPVPDTQPPTTSITAPPNGATVSGTVSVTASASDNVGVTRVEFYLDNTLSSTDTVAPYAWNWDTTSSSNGAHSLASKAYDAAGNVGSSAAISVTVSNAVGLDISNWSLTQANSSITFFIPAGTVIPDNGYAVIGRDATKQQFEAFWRGGSPLPSNVVYLNSAGAFPVINGSENYTLFNAAGTKIDGRTISMASGALQSIQRKDPCLAAGKSSSWNILPTTSATPGSGAGAGCAKGVVINEFSDAGGTGNFIYEFVELHYDR